MSNKSSQYALLIGASTHSDQGDKFFHDKSSKFGERDKKHMRSLPRISFGKYMMHWRFM